VPTRDQSLKDCAQKFRVKGDLDVKGGALFYGEVVAGEEVFKDGLEDGIGQAAEGRQTFYALIQLRALKQATVEEGRFHDDMWVGRLALASLFFGVGEDFKEEEREVVVVEVFGRLVVVGTAKQVQQVIRVAVQASPSFGETSKTSGG
jgi:hypothetical protein